MLLRENRKLIITLFMMMVNVGIPELQSVQSVEYLQKTLQPNLDDEDARKHIQNKIEESLKNAWQTKIHERVHIFMHYK